jgi:hypothetical protein
MLSTIHQNYSLSIYVVVMPTKVNISKSLEPEWTSYIQEDRGIAHKLKLHGLSPQANYTNRATAACQ